VERKKINIADLTKRLKTPWLPVIACKVGDADVKVAMFEGQYYWHRHDEHDEFMYVIKGEMAVEFEDETIAVGEGEAMFVPKGVVHRSSAKAKSFVLICEKEGILGDFIRCEQTEE
jgi:mannose-6-phosphate isomerase-like protein (cupin superfamily)